MCVPKIMCVPVSCVCLVFTTGQKKALKGIRSPGSGLTDRCEPLYGFWELNMGPLLERPVLALNPSAPLLLFLCLLLLFYI